MTTNDEDPIGDGSANDPSGLLDPARRRPRRLLIVDDDPAIRLVLTINFEYEGYEVSIAGDGDEAIMVAKAVHPDIMILDVMMPCSDGFSVLRTLRSSPQTDDIPIVMLSAKASDEEVDTGRQSGADSYMTKPFEVDEMISLVDRILTEAATAEGGSGS